MAAAQEPAEGTDLITAPVGHTGRWLVDRSGRVIVTHGLNMVAKRPPYLPSRLGFGADDARWIRAQGFTSVRLGIIAAGVQPTPDAFDEAYLDDIAATIRVLHAAGLATLVDLHQDYYTESTGGEGFPGWMVRDRPGLARLGVGRRDAAPFDGLWLNDGGVQDDIARLWTHVAARLRAEPGILGYDLFNEPYPGSRADECARIAGCAAFDTTMLAPFFRRLIAGVRAADPERLVFVEPGVSFNQGAPSYLGDTGDDRTGFSFHVYCSEVVAAPSCDVRQPGAFANAERQAGVGGDALLLTEFGATDDLGRLTSVLDDADHAMVGWQQWAYFNEDPCCARPHEGLVRTLDRPPGADTVKAEKLEVLARPTPVLIAGTPQGWGWDAKAGRLQVRWSTARVGAANAPSPRALAMRATQPRRAGPHYTDEGQVSVLEVPPASVPGRWRVRVTGGRVISAPGQRTVRVRADAGATTVTVVVERV
ncbi:MAG: endoglycoceramidase [Solirubrobacterales bacterium]|nr:endoglycoceramidase [Solirubrobacterales bacterium]